MIMRWSAYINSSTGAGRTYDYGVKGAGLTATTFSVGLEAAF